MFLFYLWLMGFALILCVASTIFWFFWWPLRLFLYSMIPAHVAYAWVGKLLIIVIVGWLGGVGIPLTVLLFGFLALFALITSQSNY